MIRALLLRRCIERVQKIRTVLRKVVDAQDLAFRKIFVRKEMVA